MCTYIQLYMPRYLREHTDIHTIYTCCPLHKKNLNKFSVVLENLLTKFELNFVKL